MLVYLDNLSLIRKFCSLQSLSITQKSSGERRLYIKSKPVALLIKLTLSLRKRLMKEIARKVGGILMSIN